MELKDYTQSTLFCQLFQLMGISSIQPLPIVEFTREIHTTISRTKIDDADANLIEILKGPGIEIKITDLDNAIAQPLELNGRKVCVYIRDQRQNIDRRSGTSGYRYHLCNCKTLQEMRGRGREHRYMATKRSDGLFHVNDLSMGAPIPCTVRMQLCKNCIAIMEQKRMYTSPFSLHDYFKNHDSNTPRTIQYEETVTEIQTYAPNFNDISKEYKKAVNHTCSICRVNCSNDKKCLHLHHIDGNKANNNRHNLLVLCVECHSLQPLHAHMKNNPGFMQDMERIRSMRTEQGLH